MNTAEAETATEFKRDDKGRPIAEDGYPLAGNATAREVSTVASLAISTIYAMIASGELESRAFGRSRRVPWTEVRRKFLS
ncbi:hypothetical protein [Fuerstiella marisgermanici]|uniref:Helix-turn-helix domain-containing protein n=1 Tax=Fuerstiella marisgermanici TaxID=1891926 RepID=A0A1P8WSA2_9PLAN|nr:hypothetical protein [Fuerstiella marisgermanici]APZ96934.1 hypothetical protein Fuma_06610 [Fuerstiella marisgermanici]